MSVFEAVLARVPACSSPQGELLTLPFLETCRLVLPVIGAPRRRAHAKNGEPSPSRRRILPSKRAREPGYRLHARALGRERQH
jgi:hypothetical protein